MHLLERIGFSYYVRQGWRCRERLVFISFPSLRLSSSSRANISIWIMVFECVVAVEDALVTLPNYYFHCLRRIYTLFILIWLHKIVGLIKFFTYPASKEVNELFRYANLFDLLFHFRLQGDASLKSRQIECLEGCFPCN